MDLDKRKLKHLLKSFDEALTSHKLKSKIRLEILGGAAMLLHHSKREYRRTVDIDTITLPSEIRLLAARYGINSNVNNVAVYPPGYHLRLEKSRSRYKNLEVYYLSKIDMILTKIQRYDNKDSLDLHNGELFDLTLAEKQTLIELGETMSNYMSFIFKENWNYIKRGLL